MFYVVLFAALALLIRVLVVRGLRPTMAFGWALTLLLPVWMFREYGSLRFELQNSITLFLIVCVLLHPSTRLPKRLVFTDILVLALIAVVSISLCMAYEWKETIVLGAALEWGAPYVLGRLLFSNRGEIARMQQVAVWVCLILSIWAICESVFHVNPLMELAHHDSIVAGAETYRLGLKRAEGPFTHPIYFGFVLVMLFPWALSTAQQAKLEHGPMWKRLLPWLNAAAVCFTLSRGPMIGLLLTCYATAFFHFKPWRLRIGLAGATALLLVIGLRSFAMDALYSISNEMETKEIIHIHDEPYVYTGASHRWLQFLVFKDAIEEAGLFGFGRMAPLDEAPHFEFVELELRPKFASIDNHYIFMVLGSGYLGVGLFLLIGLCAMYYLAKEAGRFYDPQSLLAAATCAAVAAGLVMMSTVWFATDYGFNWMVIMGMAAGWRAQAHSFSTVDAWQLPQADRRRSLAVQRRLSPGHPSLR